MSKSAIGTGGFSLSASAACTLPAVTRLQATSNTAAISSAHPRRHRDSVSTIGVIVSSAGLEAGQARVPVRSHSTDD